MMLTMIGERALEAERPRLLDAAPFVLFLCLGNIRQEVLYRAAVMEIGTYLE